MVERVCGEHVLREPPPKGMNEFFMALVGSFHRSGSNLWFKGFSTQPMYLLSGHLTFPGPGRSLGLGEDYKLG